MFKRLLATLLLLALIVVALPTPAHAGTITVNSADDPPTGPVTNDGKCTIREALQNANFNNKTNDCAAGSGTDTIAFSGVSKITLSDTNQTGWLAIDDNTIINAPITFDGGGQTRIFVVAAGKTLTLSGVTLQNGDDEGGGGAILTNQGNLDISNSIFKNNHADVDGGAINANGIVEINNTVFEGNTAGNNGGAIYESDVDEIVIQNSTFRLNTAGKSGGAIYGSGGIDPDPQKFRQSILYSAFDGNVANGADTLDGGGAIFIYQNAEYLIAVSAFSGNSVLGAAGRGGAIYNAFSNELTIVGSHFGSTPIPFPAPPFSALSLGNTTLGADSMGGAIYSRDNLLISRSSFFGNISAGDGGGIATDAVESDNAAIVNSTISGNSANGRGGGIYQFTSSPYREVSLYNVTIAGNTAGIGGGVFNNSSTGSVVLYNTILSTNTPSNCGGSNVDHQGGSLAFGSNCAANNALETGSPKLQSPELLFGLYGIGYYRPIGKDSAASGLGVPSVCSNALVNNTDHAGGVRPQGYQNCDAGAYETNDTPPEIIVEEGAFMIPDGSVVSFGTIQEGSPLTKTISVTNSGDDTLTLGALSSAPTGFSLTNFGKAELVDKESTTFTVTCDGDDAGVYSGVISFTNNDSDENPFNFTVQCTVNALPTPTASETLEGGTPHPTSTSTPIPTLVPPTATHTATITPGGPTLTPTNTITPGGPTLTPTATLDLNDREILSNNGFELKDLSQKPILLPWKVKNGTADKIKCNKPDKLFSRSGDCAFQFKGGGANGLGEASKLSQDANLIGLPFATGDLLEMSLYVKATNNAASGKIKVRVKYSDGTTAGKINGNIVQSVDYTEIPGAYIFESGAVNKITISIQHTSPAGKVFLDDISLRFTAGGGLRQTENGLVPLP
jgi:predicted outer membrane repeat protein